MAWPRARYRYPSSFFLPPHARLGFVRDGFHGLLPAPYLAPAPHGSRLAPTHFNDQNRDEPSLYTDGRRCDVLIDLRLPDSAPPKGVKQARLVTWRSRRFLDPARSPAWSRALWVPFGVSERRNAWAQYEVQRRVQEFSESPT